MRDLAKTPSHKIVDAIGANHSDGIILFESMPDRDIELITNISKS